MNGMGKASRQKLLWFVCLQVAVLLFSATGIFTKLASREAFLSGRFILLYGSAVLLMVVYAFLWQQFLKVMPLNTAYAGKSMSTVWSILFGCIFFHEQVSLGMILGSAIIIVGVYLVVTADE